MKLVNTTTASLTEALSLIAGSSFKYMQKQIAYFEGNRPLNKLNVKKHKESLLNFGGNLQPLLYIEAAEVGERTIKDADTGEKVAAEDYLNYWVVVDGQHRYTAAKELTDEGANFTLDKLKWEEVQLNGKTVEEVLIEVNTRTQPWRGADYIGGCILQHPNEEAVKFAKELTDMKVSAKTVNKYLFFKDKFKWSVAMADIATVQGADVERAKAIWAVAKTFPEKMVKKSIIIDYIIDKGGEKHWQEELDAVKKITNEQKETLKNTKVSDLKAVFEKMI